VFMQYLKMAALVLVLGSGSAFGQESATDRLQASPRRHEWVKVKREERVIHSFVVYPQAGEKSPVVVVVHENRGLTDWVRSVADRLAEEGVIAIAPDLLSGVAPKGGRTSDFPNSDVAMQAIYKLPSDLVVADLQSVVNFANELPEANGKTAIAGFCWGGSQAFRFATQCEKLAAAFVFYGSGPESKETVQQIACPVYGFYGGKDWRINTTVSKTAEIMKEAGKIFEPIFYGDAGHAFMRTAEEPGPQPANRKAHDEAWARWKELLRKF
jgi:carboxymethylenebutenolidase